MDDKKMRTLETFHVRPVKLVRKRKRTNPLKTMMHVICKPLFIFKTLYRPLPL